MVSNEKRNQLFKSLHNAENKHIQNNKIIRSEYNQIINLDIPVFYSKSNCVDIFTYDSQIIQDNIFQISGLDLALEKIKYSSKKELNSQVNLIELSFCIHEGYRLNRKAVKGKYFDFKPRKQISNNKRCYIYDNIKHKIDDIISKLNKKAIKGDFDINTFTDLIQSHHKTWKISQTIWGLFDGLDGISFFYLNYYLVFKDSTILKQGIGYINEGIERFNKLKDYYASISGFNKISLMNFPISTFYIAELYLDKGIEISALTNFSIKNILKWIKTYYKEDYDYDIMAGGAGTIIYLLKLYERTQDREVLTLSINIANRLVKESTQFKNSICWVSKYGKAHAGFSHGSSGFTYAFAKLNSILSQDFDKDYNEIIVGSLNFERNLFDNSENYWHFYRSFKFNKTVKKEYHYWAYGSGSIGQSRLLILSYYLDNQIIDELEIAINNLKEKGATGNLNYSSGVFGNLDLLNSYALQYNDENLYTNILIYLDSNLSRMRNNKEWACVPLRSRNNIIFYEMNGLFTGITGIGNVLLNIYNYDSTQKLFD